MSGLEGIDNFLGAAAVVPPEPELRDADRALIKLGNGSSKLSSDSSPSDEGTTRSLDLVEAVAGGAGVAMPSDWLLGQDERLGKLEVWLNGEGVAKLLAAEARYSRLSCASAGDERVV